jgi:hypothetical protein
MSAGEEKHRLDAIDAPYNKHVLLDDVTFDSGMHLLRVTIREGRRFTQIDLDADTAARWARIMLAWSASETTDDQA